MNSGVYEQYMRKQLQCQDGAKVKKGKKKTREINKKAGRETEGKKGIE